MLNQSGTKILEELRAGSGEAHTAGLSDETIETFLQSDSTLADALTKASSAFSKLSDSERELLKKPEKDALHEVQDGLLNFYPEHSVSPYLPLAASGPWIVSCYGAVIYDTGGYGMLGFGHGPKPILDKMSEDYVMANVMTASFSQRHLIERLREKIGFRRPKDRHPFEKFVCMNSGSEANAVAGRISDILAKKLTDPGGRYDGREIMLVSLESGFHGRTLKPARASDSCREKYSVLASFRDVRKLITIPPNDIAAARKVFGEADEKGLYFEMMFMEPVMGEGNPGCAITPEFYSEVRKLTKEHGTLLLVDSIQAALRTRGVLSITDYPGFEELPAPDLESYSKALNGGQYPLSVLALTKETADIYIRGVYGNTMTTNPRALETACAVLDQLDDDFPERIENAGAEFLAALDSLKDEFPGKVVGAQGTGLLLSLELEKSLRVVGYGGVEEIMRRGGVNVIHGGENSLRFTPQFLINTAEIELIIEHTRSAISEYLRT